ncbi:MAG: hypothetical protein PHO18_00925 [Synergistaceae bacterium]|nr:hypothetical protein [Synergistaceae bacterium]
MQISADLLKAHLQRFLISLLIIAVFCVFPSISSAEVRIEEKVGKLLVNEFDPERITVQATGGGSFLYAKATGIVIEGVRIESVSLYAMMKEPPNNISEYDKDRKYKLADLIHYSRGEVVLLEKDFKDYARKEIEDIKGFKNLDCDFSKNGIRVSGAYTATFLFKFNIRMEVLSKLAFNDSGLNLTDTTLYVAGVKQPEYITSQLIERINPLIAKEKIPFPDRITSINFTDDRIVITGDPKPLKDAKVWTYSRS